jgi:hypothetical protein
LLVKVVSIFFIIIIYINHDSRKKKFGKSLVSSRILFNFAASKGNKFNNLKIKDYDYSRASKTVHKGVHS